MRLNWSETPTTSLQRYVINAPCVRYRRYIKNAPGSFLCAVESPPRVRRSTVGCVCSIAGKSKALLVLVKIGRRGRFFPWRIRWPPQGLGLGV